MDILYFCPRRIIPQKGVWGFSSGENQGETEILIW